MQTAVQHTWRACGISQAGMGCHEHATEDSTLRLDVSTTRSSLLSGMLTNPLHVQQLASHANAPSRSRFAQLSMIDFIIKTATYGDVKLHLSCTHIPHVR